MFTMCTAVRRAPALTHDDDDDDERIYFNRTARTRKRMLRYRDRATPLNNDGVMTPDMTLSPCNDVEVLG